jgi:hypothetical protein
MKKYLVGLVVLIAMTTAHVFADVGSKADVAGVRAAEHNKFPNYHVAEVRVAGDYAFLGWETQESGGFAVYKRISGETWKLLRFSGGATDASDLTRHGVPASVAHQLCPHKFCN